MLEVQKYLKENTIESLEQIGVFAKYNSDCTKVILDYDMVESSKHKENPIVCECRGLVLNTKDYSIVHKSFNRFFNLNEASCTGKFNWDNFSTSTKEDGSLIKIRYYKNEFFITTRNSFADSECGQSGKSWAELVLSCLTIGQKNVIACNEKLTFVFELCSPHNTVVVNHKEPKLVLLGLFDEEGYEINLDDIDEIFTLPFNRPQKFDFKSLDEVIAYLDKLEENKDDTEGVVIKDSNGIRIKCKSKWYLQLHKLSGNGNIALLKNIVPIILQGETDEVLSYFPYLKERFAEVQFVIDMEYEKLSNVWFMAKYIEAQKDFAIYITKENHTPYSSILFNLKKTGLIQDEMALKHLWNQSENLILKVIDNG